MSETRMAEWRRSHWIVAAFSALLIGGVVGCVDNDDGNGTDYGEEFGETYEPLEGVWQSESFERDNFYQYVELDVDGPSSVASIYDADRDQVVFSAQYFYEVGDDVDATRGGETIGAKEIDFELVDVLVGEEFAENAPGTRSYDIIRIEEGGAALYLSPGEALEPENRPTTLDDVEYTRQ